MASAREPDPLAEALAGHGGLAAPPSATAQLRTLLEAELDASRAELAKARSGRVTVAFAPGGRALVPADPRLRADPGAVGERTFLVAAAAVGALVQAGGGALEAGGEESLELRAPGADPELAVLAFEEAHLDRVRHRALAVPEVVLRPAGLRPLDETHPLAVAARVARLGGDPTDPASIEAHEETVLAGQSPLPHDDPDPAGRIARRILQRLNGMGKWGGYHTEFVHLPRGFAGNERALAMRVGEALVAAGLLAEKQSVGQRHVYLNPRRAGDIHRMIETGERPAGLELEK